MNIFDSNYYNPTHGLELYPDINTGFRQNENGILFLNEYIILKHMKGEYIISDYRTEVDRLIKSMEVEPGLFNRGSQDKDINYRFRRTISHDNMSAICSLSKLLDLPYGKDIYEYGIRHGSVYNNVKPRWRAPMNPGSSAIWAKLGGSTVLHFLLLPIVATSFFLTIGKPKEDTSGKLLLLVELYPLRDDFVYSAFWKKYVHAMAAMYGSYWLQELMGIYFKDTEHPNNVKSKGLKVDV